MLSLTKPATRKSFFIALAVVIIIIAIGALAYMHSNAQASIAGWKAGRIIDDSVFTNKNSMNVSQIQSFLNNKVPTCDTNGTQTSEYGGPDLNGDGRVQRWEWGKSKYNQTTFPCLKDYVQDGKKASQIIYEASQEFSINPQVLLVLLQKEQSLVTDTWPLNLQYRSATGYGCPDTAACDSKYYGLTNQVRWAATMFRAIMNASPTWYTPYVLGNNYIQYNPSASCGGSNVNIENRATQALYNYTPYQPNSAALNAGWGSANCGAYGNRNFYLYFSNWFGNPNGVATYGYSVVSLEAYSDSAYETRLSSSPIIVEPNSTTYLKVTVKNTGNQVWYKDFLRIGTEDPQDRSSLFSNDTWIGGNRPTQMSEETVAPGGIATLLFAATSPAELGDYKESFGVLLEKQRWLTGIFSYSFRVTSANPYYQVNTTDLRVYSDQKKTKELDPSSISMYSGSKIYITLKIKNIGNRDLSANITKIATHNPKDRTSLFSDSSWLTSSNRVTAAKDGSITPGSIGTFEFSMTAPVTEGLYTETFGMVMEDERWVSANVASFKIGVSSRPPSSLTSGDVLQKGSSIMSPDERYQLVFQSDGNLVLYSPDRALWASWTTGRSGSQLVLQSDGNLVIYDTDGKAIWHTKTMGSGLSDLYLQSDGNLVLYSSAGHTWHTRTNGQL